MEESPAGGVADESLLPGATLTTGACPGSACVSALKSPSGLETTLEPRRCQLLPVASHSWEEVMLRSGFSKQ